MREGRSIGIWEWGRGEGEVKINSRRWELMSKVKNGRRWSNFEYMRIESLWLSLSLSLSYFFGAWFNLNSWNKITKTKTQKDSVDVTINGERTFNKRNKNGMIASQAIGASLSSWFPRLAVKPFRNFLLNHTVKIQKLRKGKEGKTKVDGKIEEITEKRGEASSGSKVDKDMIIVWYMLG